MKTTIVVLAPVLGRPQNAGRLASSLAASTEQARLLFLCSPDDDAEIAACRATGCETLVVPWENTRGDFARKINYGYRQSDEPFILMGADDLLFHLRWDRWLLIEFAKDSVGVVGTNDLVNPEVLRGYFATHPGIRRDYIDEHGTIDGDGILHEGYGHNFCDRELAETAMFRRAWMFARRSKVEHRHPHFRRHRVERDATYDLGDVHFKEDRRLFMRRRPLWGGRSSMGRPSRLTKARTA